MARYDEDLHENVFFQTLVSKHPTIFSEAAENRWMICVPRLDSLARMKPGRTDFENHILKPVGEEGTKHFVSISQKQATIDGDIIKVGQGYKDARQVKILFEECFFNSREESYQVFCLEQPLEGATTDDFAIVSLESWEDCCKFLWAEPGSDKVKKSVDRLLEFFQIERGTNIRPLMDAVSAVYTRAVQEVYKLRKFQGTSQKNFAKLAVETYVMAGLHKKLFKELCFHLAHKDSEMNKITRNLSDTHPQYLGIKAQFWLCLPKAKSILSQLNQFVTPLDKLYCFKRCISVLIEMPMDGTYEAVTADELLPLLVYLVIVCDIPNWNGNVMYIGRFHFSQVGMEEFAYYLASFEAAVEYVRTQAHQIASMDGYTVDKLAVSKLRSNSSVNEEEASPVKLFFKWVCEGDVGAVQDLLEKAQREADAARSQLCHPLCTCKKCEVLENRQLDDSDRVTVYSRDGDGRTGLHHAARMGHTGVVRFLLQQGAIVAATDHHSSTPLHLACQKGHQKCALLLLGEGSSANLPDNAGNTPLHLACSNGHEECVKVVLFHASEPCHVDEVNQHGDTPLHNAARWGYASIVSLLLEHGASTNIQNKRNEVPSQCAQSRKVQELLSSAKMGSRQTHGKEELASSHRKSYPGSSGRGRKLSQRRSESMDEGHRQLKKLFRAIQDGDINYMKYLFGWNDMTNPESKFCHPLCQCVKCSKLRNTPAARGGLTVDTCDVHGQTPLHCAAQQGNTTMVDLLLKHGASIDVKTWEHQLTPLHLACQYNHKDVVMRLLECRAETNPRDTHGNTPLHFACNNGHIESAKLILIHGADVTVTNSRGDTPLHGAARWNHPMVVSELLLFGAQYSVTNKEDKTPQELTKDEEVQELISSARKGQLDVGSYRQPPSPNLRPNSLHVPSRPIHGSPGHSPTAARKNWVGNSELETGSPRTSRHTPNEKLDALLRQIESFERHTPTSSLAIGAEEEKSVPFASPPPSTQEEEERDILYSDNFGAL